MKRTSGTARASCPPNAMLATDVTCPSPNDESMFHAPLLDERAATALTSFSRNTRRSNLPVGVRGNSFTSSTSRGSL